MAWASFVSSGSNNVKDMHLYHKKSDFFCALYQYHSDRSWRYVHWNESLHDSDAI